MKQRPKKKTAQMPRILAGKPVASPDPARKQRIQQYETAVRLMREGKYEKAKTALGGPDSPTMPATWSIARACTSPPAIAK